MIENDGIDEARRIDILGGEHPYGPRNGSLQSCHGFQLSRSGRPSEAADFD
jgi:hypothetical protein